MKNNVADELEDITYSILPQDTPSLYQEINVEDFTRDVLLLMEEYIENDPTCISEPNFHETFVDEIKCLIQEPLLTSIYWNDDLEEDFDTLFDEIVEIFYSSYMPRRSYSDSVILTSHIIDVYATQKQIDYLKNIPQPQQRTKEWYDFRNNLITASNAYKAFENQTVKNQLIYEKCKTVNDEETKTSPQLVNVNSPMHHGQKFEPLSVMIYEDKYKTLVGEFGCIQHSMYKFLGASPDGINIEQSSPRFGRMLEIKNIVNREIDGIPKKEYWIQMQLQMEVCDLDECDFLETRFLEYKSDDAKSERMVFDEDGDFTLSKNGSLKGVILYFSKPDGSPFYVYKPLNITKRREFSKWEDSMIEEYQNKEFNYTWIKNIYWQLEEFSCVLVQRNRVWFNSNIWELKQLWECIEHDRIHGFTHRAPTKRAKKESSENEEETCMISINKDTGKTIVNTPIVKIRTESFDDTKRVYLVGSQ